MTGIRIMHPADIHFGMENYGRPDPATGPNDRVTDFLPGRTIAGLQHPARLGCNLWEFTCREPFDGL